MLVLVIQNDIETLSTHTVTLPKRGFKKVDRVIIQLLQKLNILLKEEKNIFNYENGYMQGADLYSYPVSSIIYIKLANF